MRVPLETLQQIKLEYQQEYAATLKRLQDLKIVLDQLQDIPMPENILEIAENRIKTTPVAADEDSETEEESISTTKQEKTTTPKKAKGKRGRKSVWGKFIVTRLKSVQRPLTLDDLANHAIVTMKLESGSFAKTRQSLVNAVFGLRQKEKIITVGVKGTREKVIALPQWVDEREKLLPDYQV